MAKLGNNSDIASEFIERLDDIYTACGYIMGTHKCEGCPIKYNCIDDTSVGEFANYVTRDKLKEFLDYADEVERSEL